MGQTAKWLPWGAVLFLSALPISGPASTRTTYSTSCRWFVYREQLEQLEQLVLRGGGQKAQRKKTKDDKKEALRQQLELEDRWRTPEEVAAKKAKASASAERAVLRAKRGDNVPTAGSQYPGKEEYELCRNAAVAPHAEPDSPTIHRGTGGSTLDGVEEGVGEGGASEEMDIGDDSECALEASDVVFLESDEVCVGPDGEDITKNYFDSNDICSDKDSHDTNKSETVHHLQLKRGAGRSSLFSREDPEEGAEMGEERETEWGLRNELDSSKFCLAHTDAVYGVAISPFARNLVATGGGDDAVTLWNVADAEEGEEGGDDETKSGVREARATRPRERSLENATFGDSVVGLAFSHDGTYLAAAGMDGYVRVWLADCGQLVAELEGSGGGFIWMQWHPRGHVVLAGADDGCTFMWEVVHSRQLFQGTCLQVFAGHCDAVTCGGFGAAGRLVVTGTTQGCVRVYSPKDGSLLHCLQDQVNLHKEAITAMAFHPSDPIVVSCDQQGRVKVVQVETGKVKMTLPAPPTQGHTASVESVAISRHMPGTALTGSLDGSVCVWELSSGIERCRTNLCLEPERIEGVTKVLWASHMPMFVAGGVYGSIMVCSAMDGQRLRSLRAHTYAIHDMALSRDDTWLLTASEDATARVFSLR